MKYMRLSAAEKAEIIRVVKRSELGVNRTLAKLGIHKRTFYNWYSRWAEGGQSALEPCKFRRQQWNSIPAELKNLVVEVALDAPELSSRELAVTITDEHQLFISVKRLSNLEKKRAYRGMWACFCTSSRPVSHQNPICSPDVANRLYILQNSRLGMVLPLNRNWRL